MKLQRFAAACVAAGVLITAGTAHAADGIAQEFFDLCINTSTLQAAEAAARAAGYASAPTDVAEAVKRLTPSGKVLSRSRGGETLVFITQAPSSRKAVSGTVFSMDACLVGSRPAQADLSKSLQALLGVGEPQPMEDAEAFAYELKDSRRVRVNISDRDEAEDAARRGSMNIAGVDEANGFRVAVLTRVVVLKN